MSDVGEVVLRAVGVAPSFGRERSLRRLEYDDEVFVEAEYGALDDEMAIFEDATSQIHA